MSVYAELLEAVSNGQKFKVDLINKSLWINRKQYIKEGEIVYGSDCFIKEEDLDKHWKHKPLRSGLPSRRQPSVCHQTSVRGSRMV